MPYQDLAVGATNSGMCTIPSTPSTFSLPTFTHDDGGSKPSGFTTVSVTKPTPPKPPKDDGPKGYYIDVPTYSTRSRTTFDKFTDISISRPKLIQFTVTNLRPNTRHFVFYDGVDVTRYCKKDNTAEFTAIARSSQYRNPGDKFIREDEFPSELGGPTAEIYSENDGSLTGWFYLQRGQEGSAAEGVEFPTGRRKLEFCDISILNRTESLSYGEGVFTSDGGIESYTKTFYKVKTGTKKVWVPTT